MKKLLSLAAAVLCASSLFADGRAAVIHDLQAKPPTDTSFTPDLGMMVFWDPTYGFPIGSWRPIVRDGHADGECMVLGASVTHVPGWGSCGGGASTLTATYVGFGDPSNVLTGSAKLTWDDTDGTLAATTTGTADARGYVVRQYTNDQNGPRFVGIKYRGTTGSPAAAQNGDTGVVVVGGAYSPNGNEVFCSGFRQEVDDVPSGDSVPMGWSFYSDRNCSAPFGTAARAFSITSDKKFRLFNAAGTHYAGISADAVTSDYTFAYPASIGTVGQTLVISSVAGSTAQMAYGVLGSAGGGTGGTGVTAHQVVIGEGSSPFAGVALGANVPLLGTSAADPHASTSFAMADSSATLTITEPSAGNPGNVNFIDVNGAGANLKRATTNDKVSLTNKTRTSYADAYSMTFAGGALGKYYSASIGTNHAFTLTGTDLTIARAFHPTAYPSSGKAVLAGVAGDDWQIAYDASATYFRVKGPSVSRTATGAAPTLNQDNLIVVRTRTSDNTTCIWVNNVLGTCDTYTYPNGVAGTFTISGGAGVFDGTAARTMEGRDDDTVAWASALTDTQVGNLWNSGSLQSPNSWPAGFAWRFRMDETSNTTITDDVTGTSLSLANSGTAPTVLQTNVWPATVGTFNTNRNVISQEDGATPGLATTNIGDSNTGLTVNFLTDTFTINTAASANLFTQTATASTFTTPLTAKTSITLNGATSGSAGFKVAAAAGTPGQWQLPTTDAAGVLHSNGALVTSWSAVALTDMATQAANTIVANATASTAAPTAIAVPSCADTGGNHLNWTSGSGFGCGTSGSGGGGTTNYYGSGLPIGQCVLTGGTTCTITLPAGYQDVRFTFSGGDTSTSSTTLGLYMQMNGDATSGNYSSATYVLGTGASATSGTVSATANGGFICNIPGTGGTATAIGTCQIFLPNYAGTSFQKYAQSLASDFYGATPTRDVFTDSFFWKSTAAITSVKFTTSGTAFRSTTYITAYGDGGTAGTNVGIGGVNGSLQSQVENHESLTLSGATTDTTANVLAAPGITEIVNYRITTNITGSGVTGFQIGTSGTATQFCGTQSTLTSGTTGTCLAHIGTTSQQQAAAAKIRVTAVGGNFSGGVIELQVFSKTSTPPTS